MSVSWVGGQSLGYATRTNTGFNVSGVGVTANDIIVIAMAHENRPLSVTLPGFDDLLPSPFFINYPTNDARLHAYYKRATAGDTGIYAFNHPSAGTGAWCGVYRGGKQTGVPIGGLQSIADTNTDTIPIPAVTTVTAGAMAVALGASWDPWANVASPPASWTHRMNIGPTNSIMYVIDRLMAAAGSTGTINLDGPSTGDGVGIAFYIEPEVAAAGGKPKVWNGSAWVEKPAKVWSGSAWNEKPMKVWTGSAWVLA